MMIRKQIVVLSKGMYQVSLMNGFVKNRLKGIRNITNGTMTLSKNFNTVKQFDIDLKYQAQIDNNTTHRKQQTANTNSNNKNQQSNIIEKNNKQNTNLFNLLNLHKQTKQLLQQLSLQQQTIIANHNHISDTLSSSQQVNQQQQQQHIKKKRLLLLFDQQQYLKRVVQVKYYYSDIVSVASQLIQLLMGDGDKDNRRGDNSDNNILSSTTTSTITNNRTIPTPTSPTTPTHLHFLLYVYHLYPRQCKDLKQRITLIIQQFINYNNNQNIINHNNYNNNNQNTITLKSRMQFLFYLRKFIQNEQYHQLNEHITNVNVKYVKWLRLMYGREKDLLIQQQQLDMNKKDDNSKDNNDRFLKQITSRLQLLHDYLLMFPNLRNANISTSLTSTRQSNNDTKNNSKKNNKHNKAISLTTSSIPPQQIMSTFDYFTTQYSQYTTMVIKHYLENIKQINILNSNNKNNTNNQSMQHNHQSMQHNHQQQHQNNTATHKHLLQNQPQQISSSAYKQCFDLIKLLTHRLLVMFNLPTNNTRSVKQQQKQQTQKQQNADQQILLLMKKYCDNKINLLKYLPISKMESQYQLIAVLMLIKQLIASYHIVRDIRHQHITNYLLTLMKNNQHLIVINKNDTKHSQQLKRQIKSKINQLVSKLASCSWVDKDDQFNQYLLSSQFTYVNTKTNMQVKNIHKDSWYQVNSQ